MLRTLAYSIFLILFSIVPASALERLLTPEEKSLINDISLYNSAIRSMVGRFLQIDSRGNRIEGTFFLERPNKIRFRYAPPSREEIVSSGRGFYVLNRKDETKFAYPQNQVPLRLFLQDNIDLLQANIVDVTSSTDYISISVSDDTPIGTVEVALIFDIMTKDLKQWTLTEPSGAQLTFSLYDVTLNVDIPKSYFRIPARYKSKKL